MEFQDKKLLILGGSRISGEIIDQARKMGIKTGVTDWYSYEKSPAKQKADFWHQISTSEIDQIVELIKREGYDGVITGFTDSVLPYYADICEAAGLPCYGTHDQFDLFINKHKYKKVCREYGIPVVEEYKVSAELSDDELSIIKYPVLVKPSDSSGARGITICRNNKELKQAYQKALKTSEAGEVLVERYIDGEEATVFWLFVDGKAYVSGIGNRHVKHSEGDVIKLPVGYTFPSTLIKDYEVEVQPKFEKLFHDLGVRNGMMFMQCMVEEGRCILYDIGYRLTGSLEYKLQERICGYDPMEMMIRFALTGSMVGSNALPPVTPYWKKYGLNLSFLIDPGTIGSVTDLSQLNKVPGYIDAFQSHLKGETLPSEAKGMLKQIAIRIFAEAESLEELKKVSAEIQNQVEIRSTEGESMLLGGLDPEDFMNVVPNKIDKVTRTTSADDTFSLIALEDSADSADSAESTESTESTKSTESAESPNLNDGDLR